MQEREELFSPKELEGTPVRMPWLLERSKERSGIAWLRFLFEINTHMLTYIHAWLSHASTEEERGEERKKI